MKKPGRILTLSVKSILILCLMGMVIALAWAETSSPDPAVETGSDIEAPPPSGTALSAAVELTRPTTGNLSRSLRFPGYLEPNTRVTVRPQASGILQDLEVEMGDFLSEGTLLGRIDPAAMDLNFRIADTGFQLAESSLSKLEKIYNANGLSLQDYEEALSQYEISRNQRDLALLQLGFSEIAAPITGTVLQVHTSQGSLSSPQIPLVTMGDLSHLKVKVSIPEEYYEAFHGSAAQWRIRILRNNREISEAELFRLSPLIDPLSRSFEAVCRFPNPGEKLKPGMVVKAEFITREEEGLYLPVAALKTGNTLFYLEDESMRVKAMAVNSPVFDGERIQIPEELGETPFILFGPENLQEGDLVHPVAAITGSL